MLGNDKLNYICRCLSEIVYVYAHILNDFVSTQAFLISNASFIWWHIARLEKRKGEKNQLTS
jgi:hypothetical protein